MTTKTKISLRSIITRTGLGIALAAATLAGTANATEEIASRQMSFGGFTPPKGWVAPPLHPKGVQLQTRKIGSGVYALLSNQPPVDNSGFIVGERGVLVIDAHINAAMAGQIIAAVRNVTTKPILYLVNTNAHGDHTFGNYAFPTSTQVVAHAKTAEAMRHFEAEKAALLPAVNGDAAVFDDVELRLPDITFERALKIDLGGRIVELHHFGHGNTPGDTVVYEPATKTAWTGNLILGASSIPWAIEGHTPAYLETLAKMAAALEIKTIIPGHVLTTTNAAITFNLEYLSRHVAAVKAAIGRAKA